MNGFIERNEIMRNGRIVDLVGHLHCNVFNQEKFLLNSVELRVRLVRSRDNFCRMETEALHTLHILEASLLVRRVKISPGILLAYARTLAKGTEKYPVTRVEVEAFTIHAGVQAKTLDNVILGQPPKRVILGLFSNEAFNGDRQLPTYHAGLYIVGRRRHSNTLESSATALSFDLTPNLAAECSSHWSLIKHGTLRIELRFDDALKETINCIVYAEFDSIIEVDASRQVVTDFGG
ncbi:uncharacterized protein LOC125500982 [Athalia rosae]|uniref:uncharacterized protein LOC125500982 n=1 Tax=Athalia rosae TaxID=37344 RepID=UPI0020340B91|nr:uncharacterized protein LOC125500982 [Athalia rosae]